MGYYSSVTGDLELSRPINYTEIEAVQASMEYENYPYSLEIETEHIDTPEGKLIKQTCRTITTDNSDSGKYYGLESDTQTMINALPADVTVSGYVQRDGEEVGDMERIHVLGRRVVSVKAEITWPDPS